MPEQTNQMNFSFSFTNNLGNTAGTVTGEIAGLTDNSTGPASHVFIDGYPSALGTVCRIPCDTTALFPPWQIQNVGARNSFTVTSGNITGVNFGSTNFVSRFHFVLSDTFSLVNTQTGQVVASDTITLTPLGTPLPAVLPLFATGLPALGLLGWRRRRKAQAI